MLVVFGGLPGVGKTSIASRVARESGATFLRIDTIEQAIRDTMRGDPGPAGYVVAHALARTHLEFGRDVVADCVNPLPMTREAWRGIATTANAPLLEIEVLCSDPIEHRRRVESRTSDIPGLTPPTWAMVRRREYAPWPEPHLVLDTAALALDVAVSLVLRAMREV